jgi:hypothetical protein
VEGERGECVIERESLEGEMHEGFRDLPTTTSCPSLNLVMVPRVLNHLRTIES